MFNKEEESHYQNDPPPVYKKDKASVIFLLDGLFDLSLGILYFMLFRNNLIVLVEPLQEMPYFSYNIVLFFDIVILMEFLMAGLELIAVVFIKFSKNKKVPTLIKRLFLISHVILIPLGGIINLIIDLIIM